MARPLWGASQVDKRWNQNPDPLDHFRPKILESSICLLKTVTQRKEAPVVLIRVGNLAIIVSSLLVQS